MRVLAPGLHVTARSRQYPCMAMSRCWIDSRYVAVYDVSSHSPPPRGIPLHYIEVKVPGDPPGKPRWVAPEAFDPTPPVTTETVSEPAPVETSRVGGHRRRDQGGRPERISDAELLSTAAELKAKAVRGYRHKAPF